MVPLSSGGAELRKVMYMLPLHAVASSTTRPLTDHSRGRWSAASYGREVCSQCVRLRREAARMIQHCAVGPASLFLFCSISSFWSTPKWHSGGCVGLHAPRPDTTGRAWRSAYAMASSACCTSASRSSVSSQPALKRIKPSGITSPPQRARRSAVVCIPPKLVAS